MFGVFVERKLSKLLRDSHLNATLPCWSCLLYNRYYVNQSV